MPSVSEKQRRAMEAAAHGRSTLGIPKSVGKEFVAADGEAPKGHAAGVVFVAPDGDVLMLRRARSEPNYGGHWALPGGKAEDGETPEVAADREVAEETGHKIAGPKKMLDRILTPNGFVFTTYASPVDEKFVPKLDGEHSGYAWASPDMLPQPLHPSVKRVLGEHIGVAADMSPEDWTALRENFAKWTREEEAEPEHAEDHALMAFDYAMAIAPEQATALRGRDGLAFDFKSKRTYTPEGHLHVAGNNISKANVCPYRGNEIPKWKDLGLDPNRIYQLLRDPEEMRKGAATFNNKPLLSRHVAVTADSHDPDLVMGNVSNVTYEHPYLKGDLGIWRREGIDAVESGKKQQLSSAYRYRADMTPGVYLGVPYDGVMRDIVGNHVAQVVEGRAGDDVVVGDSKLEELPMPKKVLSRTAVAVQGALAVYLQPKLDPKLAMDGKPVDIASLLGTVSRKTFKAQIPAIVKGIKKATDGLLAQDASLEDLPKLLEAFNTGDVTEGSDVDANSGLPVAEMDKDDVSADAEPHAKMLQHLKGKIPEELMAELQAMCGETAGDEDDDENEPGEGKTKPEIKAGKDSKMGKDADPPMKPAKDSDKMDKKDVEAAMDAALKKNTREVEQRVMKRMQDIADARDQVRPLVGDLTMAFDSAEEVRKHALEVAGVKGLEDIHPSAYGALVDAQIRLKPAASRREGGMAMDSRHGASNPKGFAERFPTAARLSS